MADQKQHFDTLAIHAGQSPDPTTGAIMTPVYLTSTYVQAGPGEHKGFEYSRTHNPTRNALEACIAALEGAKHGLAYASGLAATDNLMHLLDAGDHVVVGDDVYGGTFRIFDKVWKRSGLSYSFVDLTDPKNFEAAIRPNTKMLWLETPTNPMLKLFDIEQLCAIAKKRGILTVVDNTFMSPYFQKPLSLGADVVTHSMTKFINGHSDVVGGFTATNDETIHQKLRFLQNAVGGVLGPMDSFLVLRGVKTLHVRMERHAENAAKVVEFLAKHPLVERVTWPGMPEHPQHALAKKQMSGFGGMLTFVMKGGHGQGGLALERARTFLRNVKVFACAESLGGVESLIEHPAIMTHASVPAETRLALGIHDGFIRLSVGIENERDLVDDLAQAFEKAKALHP
jgi:cystathionine gamma-lyase